MLDNLHIRIFIARFTNINPSRWRLNNIQSPYWRFYLNQSDGAFLELCGKGDNSPDELYPLAGRTPYFIPAGVRFNTEITQEVGHFFIHFDILGIPAVVMRTIFNNPISLPFSNRIPQTVWEIVEELELPQRVDLVLECRLKSIIYEGLALYLQSLTPEQLNHSFQLSTVLKPVRPAINYIDANLAEPLFNQELSRLCQMNEDYFIRRFKECLGQTPGDYIREQRVKLAAQQLLFTEDSLEQIAATSGFGSRFYLSRVFKNYAGVSPVAYRKASRV